MSLTILQATANCVNGTDGGHPTCHFASAPTSGNLMIAVIVFAGPVTPAAQDGWTLSSTSNPSGQNETVGIYYKYAGASEPTAQVPDSNNVNTGSSVWAMTIWEISGGTGTWTTDHVADHVVTAIVYPAASGTTASFNTANANELVLGGFGGNSGGGNFSLGSSAYTQDSTISTYTIVGNAAVGVHTTVPTSGTGVSSTITGTPISGSANYAASGAWVELQEPSSGTETGNVSMALSGVAFAAHGSDTHAGAVLALTKVSYTGAGGRMETGNVSLALGKLSFSARASRKETGTGTLALSGVSIAAAAYDLNSLNPIRQFSTFG